jgi:hypothetical protein
MPRVTGLCGSSSVSHLAWCLRWIDALAGGQPQPEAEEMAGDGVQFQRAVRLVAMQVDGDAGDGDVRDRQSVEKYLPAGEASDAACQKFQYCAYTKIHYCSKVDVSHGRSARAEVRYFLDFERDCTLNRP